MACLLWANLSRGDLHGALRPPLRDRLREQYRRTAALNMQRAADLATLLEALEPTGARVVVLKGMALLEPLYGDPGLRPMGDVDLWVEHRQRDALVAVLTATGYRQEPFYPDTYRRGTSTIDVHTHLLGAERIRSRERMLAAGQEPLLAAARPLRFGSAHAARLSVAAELFLLGLHLLKHNAERLLWLLEINALARACPRHDWERLLELGRLMRQERAQDQIALLSRLQLGERAAEPYHEMATTSPLGSWQVRLLSRRVRHGALPIWAPLVLFSAPGWRHRPASVFETLFPRPLILRQIFQDPTTSLWRLYLRRAGQLVARALR